MTAPPGGRPAAAGTDGPPAPGRALRVLVVCQANVCRSRAATVLLRRLATAAGVKVSVRSAGIRTTPGAARCATMDAVLAKRGAQAAPDRGPKTLDAEQLAASDLVLVAEARHRAHAARLLPAARTRTFTLLEVAALADALRSGAVQPATAPGDPHDLRWVVEELHAARGRVDLSPPATRWRWPGGPKPEVPGLDLPDVHTAGRRPHERTVVRLDSALGSVVDLLAARARR